MTSHLLEVEDLAVSYVGGGVAVDGVSLTVDDEQVVAILGPNGAGKTSLLRGIGGFWRSENGRVIGGRVTLAGNDVTGSPPGGVAKHGLALVPEDRKVFTTLTVEDNLRIVPRTKPQKEHERHVERILDLFPRLRERSNLRAGYLSGGETQMLAIARALILGPRLLVIDEASLGLSPIAVETVFDLIRNVVEELGISVLMVEQNATHALALAHVAHVMASGGLVVSGTPTEIVRNDEVRRSYLGMVDR